MPRFSYALLGALALHGSLVLLRARHPLAATAKARPAPQSVELEEFPLEEALVEPTPPSAALAAPAEPPVPAALANHVTGSLSRATTAAVEASPEAAPIGDTLVAPVAAGSAEAVDAPPGRKIDLGLDGRFLLHDPGPANTAAPAAAAELGPRVRKSTAQRQLEAALSADDVQRGLARGNALLGSLSSAVRAEGPVRGEAMFRATVAADGSFGNVELLGGTAADWTAALAAFRQLAARKHVRLPPGAKGLRVTFSVKAKVQRPSGKEADDTAIGVARPSLGPNGLVPSGDFDLADLGGGAQRLVYARVVSEEVL
ncbi:MAG TPA: hypothetical protein VJV79_20690 [Polyangiaceae bacterium]|nr:hypothetical protein [Polyangiaceae bacterium]